MKRSIKFQIMARIVVVVLVIIISFAWFLYNQFTSINMNNLSKRGSEEAQRNLIQLQSAIEDVYRLSEYLVLSEEVSGFLKNLDRFTPAEKAVAAGKLMDNLDRLLVSGKYILMMTFFRNGLSKIQIRASPRRNWDLPKHMISRRLPCIIGVIP